MIFRKFIKFKSLKKLFYNLNHWETWHYLAKYIPLGPFWIYYAIRSGAVWWFTPSNPSLTFGGFEGESKREMYSQLPEETLPKTIYIHPDLSINELIESFKLNKFSFPVAVKPDAGMMGFMFRKIRNIDQLKAYHLVISSEYLIQELVDYPIEVSVFYYRYPGERSGAITGFIKKELMQVEGDGLLTLEELILNYPRANSRLDELRSKHKSRLKDIIPNQEVVILSQALNLSRGGKLISLEGEKDQKLLSVFDELSNFSKDFYYGRYDIKCHSIKELKEGKYYKILEYNGCGAEPHHIYGNNNSLIKAYSIVLEHWKILYKISKINHKNGIRYWTFMRGWKFLRNAKKHFKELKYIDSKFEL